MESKQINSTETLHFMALLTAVGGFINAYSFMTRGAFTTMMTGNMAKTGVSIAQRNWAGAWDALAPILGCLLGAFLAQLLKCAGPLQNKELLWKRTAILAEIAALAFVSFLPAAFPNALVNWFLSLVAGFQLSNFRKYEGAVHNTTICTGNLRTLGQACCDALLLRDAASAKKAGRYFVLVFSFPFGAAVGCVISSLIGANAAWLACLALAALLPLLHE